MKIKKGFVLKSVMGNNIVLAVGEATKNFKGILKFNATTTDIWNDINKGLSEEDIVKNLVSNYDISQEQAKKDVSRIINELKEKGILE